jgi:membrane-bound serine protease (ClpP class)
MSPSELMGIGLVLVAFLMFALELKAPGFGILGVAGIIAILGGMVLLFGASWATIPVLVAVALLIGAVFGSLAVLAHRAKRNKVVTGNSGMVGLEGRAESALTPDGRVLVRGELWDAVSPVRLERGEAIRVTGVRGLRLEVESADRPVHATPPRSVVHTDDDDVIHPAPQGVRGSR